MGEDLHATLKWAKRVSNVLICCAIAAYSAGSIAADSNSGSNIGRETLVWSDEFTGSAAQSAPNPANWTYDTGGGGWGNYELETYCSYGSNTAPCDPKNPNAYVGSDGYLHIAARQPTPGTYTSAMSVTMSVWGRGLKSNPEPNSANQFKLGGGLRASPTVTVSSELEQPI